ncbi:hypothetical protein Leryth_009906 [Lithospermum erythrorhizon]|nr:hypothetical protein Leryth_009906 [Lithospermum erythrorhizon]
MMSSGSFLVASMSHPPSISFPVSFANVTFGLLEQGSIPRTAASASTIKSLFECFSSFMIYLSDR